MRFIQYNLRGEIIKQYSTDFKNLKQYPIGEKVRITTEDGKEYTGFWNTYFKNNSAEKVEISRYDLDENTAKLKSENLSTKFVPSDVIVKIEAISHSNPRWGILPTNKFEFVKSRNDSSIDKIFKRWLENKAKDKNEN